MAIADEHIRVKATNSKFTRQALIVISLTVVLAVGVFVVRSSMKHYFASFHSKDEVLEANFSKYETDFQVLLEKSQADYKVIRIASDFTWLDNNAAWPRPESEWGISNERWDEYRNLFKKLGLNGGILRDNQGEITYLIVSSSGLITNGSSKGYAYCKSEPAPIVSSLDDTTSWPKGKRIIFKQLRGHWYLFYMSA
jgi:hypothetical protein